MQSNRWLSALILLAPGAVLVTPALALAQAAPTPAPAVPDAPVENAEAPAEAAPAEAASDEAAADAAASSDEAIEETTPEPAAEPTPAPEPEPEPCAPAEPPAEDAAAKAAKATETAATFQPWDVPGNETFAWVRIESSEWLKGSIKEMRDGDIIFNSDEFGDLTFSWGDIHTLYSPNQNTYVDVDSNTYTGTALLKDGKLVVKTATGEVVVEQAQLLSVVEATHTELSRYDFKATLSAAWREGNTKSIDYAAFVRLRREDEFNRARLEYTGAVGSVSDTLNTNKHRGVGNWDLFISRLIYIIPVLGEIQYDEFQNLAARWVVGAGAGIHAINSGDFKLDLEAAAGYTQTNYISVLAGTPSDEDGMLVRPRLYMDWNVTDDVEWEIDWSSSIMATDIDRTFHHGESRLSVELTSILDLDYQVIFDRQESPRANEDGDVPVKNDLAMTLGLGVELD